MASCTSGYRRPAAAILVALFTNVVERLMANLEADVAPLQSYYAARALLLATNLLLRRHTDWRAR